MKPARLSLIVLVTLSLACSGCTGSDTEDSGWTMDSGVANDVEQPDVGIDVDVADTTALDTRDTAPPQRDAAPDTDSGPDICGEMDDPDTDGDGLLDCEEEQIATDPQNADTDGDGLTDMQELITNTDPRTADTDGDGVDDGLEVDLGLDPTKWSTYDDGVCDCDRWAVSACDDPAADPANMFRSELVAIAGAPGGQMDVGNWHLALPPNFQNYTELAIDGLSYSAGAIDNRKAAAVYSDLPLSISGFLMSHTPASSQQSASGVLDDHRQALASLGTVDRQLTGAAFRTAALYSATTGHYQLTVNQARSPDQLRDELLFALAPFAPSDVSGLPTPAGATHTSFEVVVTVIVREYSDGSRQLLTAAAVAPSSSYDARPKVRIRMSDITNTTNIGQASDLLDIRCEVFEPRYTPRLDIYWVIDHADPMDDDYSQVERAANQAFTTLESTSLDFRMGATSMEPDRHGRLSASTGWHTDRTAFQNELDAITQIPHGTESRGHQAAQDGLAYMLELNGAQPPQAHKIRPDTQVVTVFASDGDDDTFHYTPLSTPQGQALLEGYTDFFIAHGLTAVALVGDGAGCGYNDGASYRLLAHATGGAHASLCAPDIGDTLDDMIFSASANTAGYPLPDTPISSTLRVFVDGDWVPRSRENGFDYFPERNAIALFGSYRPEHPDGAEPDFISVTYEMLLPRHH